MNEKDIVKNCLHIRGTSQEELAKRAGYKGQMNITGILNRGNSLRVDNFVKMLDALRFDVVVVDRDSKEQIAQVTLPVKPLSED